MNDRTYESTLVGPAKQSQITNMPTVHLPSDVSAETLLSSLSMNTLLKVASPDGNYVLKIFGDLGNSISPGLTSTDRARTEQLALNFCHANSLPAPTPIARRGNVVLMKQCVGADPRSSLTVEIVGLMLSWLNRLHSLPMPQGLVGSEVKNLHSVAARKYMEEHIAHHHDDLASQSVRGLFASIPAPVSERTTTLHGDPNVKNWLVDAGTVYALDFEFFCRGDPIYDVGMLIASLLNYGAFSPEIYSLCADSLQSSPCSLQGLPAALLCGLVIITLSVPNDARRSLVFGRIHEAVQWAGQLEAGG